MSIAVFPTIPRYRGEADALHTVRSVVCLEKIDGANTRVHAGRGAASAVDLVFGGRTLLEGEPAFCQPVLREAFVADPGPARRLCALVGESGRALTLYGETCGRGIQAQGHVYGPKPHFVLFGARSEGAWLSVSASLEVEVDDGPACVLPSLRALAERLGVALAPALYAGPPDDAQLRALAVRPSAHAQARGGRHADAAHEGIVIWSDPLRLDGAGRPIVAKLKDPRRSESLELEDERAESEGIEVFAARVILRERLIHARQHLEESGRWGPPGEARTALLVRRVVQDVAREEPAYARQIAAAGKGPVREALERRAAELLKELGDEGP